jgi:predicted mannosyl-3-phosphoglycerate phosphatase (HAD superfamily)
MPTLANSAVGSHEGQRRWPFLVVTPVNVFRDPASSELHPTVRQAAQLLIDADIPIIFVAPSAIREPEHIQRELGIVHPYLSNGGATLHIPHGYFEGGCAGAGNRDWEMMTFVTQDFGLDAPSGGLQFLVQTYRTHRSDIVTVGFGVTSSDRFVLEYVDVPVIVRNRNIGQSQLQTSFPDAFVTHSEGPLGWGEAILGGLAYESDETRTMAQVGYEWTSPLRLTVMPQG